jgi:hypothetical protein
MASLAQCVAEVNIIQNQVSRPIDFREHDELLSQLDKVKDELESLPNVEVFSKNLKDQIVCLYGKIDDSLVSYELNTIQNEALLVHASLQSGDLKTLSQTADLLKNHIASLWDHYCPSLEERRVIAFAEEQLNEACFMLEGCSDYTPCKKQKESPLSWEEILETESALQSIGEALLENDDKRAAYLFNRLSEAQKKRLCTYLPKEDRSSFLHEVEGAANNNKIFLRQR